MSPTDSPHDPAATSRSLLLAAGLVLLVQGFSLFAPMAVLGNAIQWPDSLDYPPSKMLPLLREQLDAVRLGYGLYLGYSLLFLVTGVLTVRLAARRGALGALAISLASVEQLFQRRHWADVDIEARYRHAIDMRPRFLQPVLCACSASSMVFIL